MKFEYDPQKSRLNLEKHGISLAQAAQLWTVSAVEVEARTLDEPRFIMIGRLEGKLYSCIFTKRGDVIRLISARRSREKEEKIYHEHTQQEKTKGE